MNKYNSELAQILEAVSLYRSIVMDAVEMEVGDSPDWPALRKRLLRAFGDKGLSRRVVEILTGEVGNECA
jgi:hypothetical protein